MDDLTQALTPVEIRKVLHGGQDQVLIRLWNVGAGPAVVRDVRLRPVGPAEDWTDLPPREIPAGADQAADTHIPVTTWRDEPHLMLTVHYLHSNGREYATLCDAAIRDDMLVCHSYRRIESTRREAARPRPHPRT